MTLSTNFLIQSSPSQQLWPPDGQRGYIPEEGNPDYLSRLLLALRRYRTVALAIVASGIVLTLIVLAVVPPIYSSTATVMVDSRGAQASNIANIVSGLSIDMDTVTNEVQVLTSRKLVGAVVRELGLEHDQAYDPNRGGRLRSLALSGLDAARAWLPNRAVTAIRPIFEKTPLEGRDYMDAVIDAVENDLSVGPVGRSRAISITFNSTRPGTAEEVANTLALRYLDNQTEMKQRSAQIAHDRINEELAGLRETAAEAARRVEEFRARAGLIDGRETLLIRQHISEVSTQLTAAELDTLSTASRLGDAERAAAQPGGDSSTELLKSPLIQQLRLQQFQITRDAAPALATYGAKYPGADAVSAQTGVIQKRIDEEVQKILAAIRGDHEAALERESGLRAQLDRLKTEMARLRGSEVTLNQMAQDARAAEDIYEVFLHRAKETAVGTTMQSPDAYVISNATMPTKPISPNKKVAIPVGIVMSVTMALVVVLMLDARDGGFQNPSHVTRVLGLSTLAMIPRQEGADLLPGPHSPIGAAITDLLMRAIIVPGTRCLLITSALPREGCTSVSRALARTAAANGRKTLLVDCDIRRLPQGPTMSGITAPGLLDVLDGHVPIEEMVRRDEIVDGLSVLTAGVFVENPSQPICSANLQELLKLARRSFDLIIIDGPPILAGPDAWMLALLADATVLAVRWSHTPSKAVLEAYRKLAETGVKVSGAVLTMVDTRRIPYYETAVATHYARHAAGVMYEKEMGSYRAREPARTRRANGTTKRELYELAKAKGVEGRSKMTKQELEKALHQV